MMKPVERPRILPWGRQLICVNIELARAQSNTLLARLATIPFVES
jgi:hypothetical protein